LVFQLISISHKSLEAFSGVVEFFLVFLVVVLAAALRFAIMRLDVVSGRIWTVLVVGLVGLVSISLVCEVCV